MGFPARWTKGFFQSGCTSQEAGGKGFRDSGKRGRRGKKQMDSEEGVDLGGDGQESPALPSCSSRTCRERLVH